MKAKNVEEPVLLEPDVDERGLDAADDVDDAAFVDVADVTVLVDALNVVLFEGLILQDGYPAFLRFLRIDDDLAFHDKPWWKRRAVGRPPCRFALQ